MYYSVLKHSSISSIPVLIYLIGPAHLSLWFLISHHSPADKPDRPKNCVTNDSNDAFKISCEPGSDGGSKQYFVLEIRLANSSQDDVTNNEVSDQLNDQAFDVHSKTMNKPLYKMQKESPVFDVYSLGVGLPYIFMLYAVNLKGKSEPVIIAEEPKHRSKGVISSGKCFLFLRLIYICTVYRI